MSREAILHLDLIDILMARYLPAGKFRPAARPWDRISSEHRSRRINSDEIMRVLRPHLYD